MTLRDELIEAMYEIGFSLDGENVYSDTEITKGKIYKRLEFYRNGSNPVIILLPAVENEDEASS